MRLPVSAIKTFKDVQRNFDFLSTLGIDRRVKGVVDGTTGPPTIVAGKGFSCVRNATGDYTVTFDKPFASTAVALPVGAGPGIVCRIYAESSTSFSFFTFVSTTGASTNSKFHFTAEPS